MWGRRSCRSSEWTAPSHLGASYERRDRASRVHGLVHGPLRRREVDDRGDALSRAPRAQIGAFVEVYVHATVEEIAAHRDPKGLYRKALAGEITGFTGVDDPYEAPEDPELVLDTMVEEPVESLQNVLTKLRERGYVDDDTVMVEGERAHSGMTDLRVTKTGHVSDGR